MDNLSLVLSCVALSIGLIAFTCSCLAISFIVGLKNSTHKIEWKTYNPYDEDETPRKKTDEPEEELDGEAMMVNPNKRIPRQEPFVPFPPEPKEEEPFVDAEDPNNIVHDFN